MSRACEKRLRHNVLMEEDDEEIAETKWREAFRLRLRDIQGDRSNEDMGDLLGIDPNRYSKYVGQRLSLPPIRLLPRLAKIGAVRLEWLILGDAAAKKTSKKATGPAPSQKNRGKQKAV